VLLIVVLAGVGWVLFAPSKGPEPTPLLDTPTPEPAQSEPTRVATDPSAEVVAEPRPFPSAPEPDWALAMQAFYQVERVVVCSLEPSDLEALGVVSVGDEPEQEGSGHLMVPGYVPVPLSWRDARHGRFGRCRQETVELHPGRAIVRGLVTHTRVDGEAAASVRGCGNWTLVADDDTFEMEVVPEPCAVHATRFDGMLPSVSEPAAVEPILGGIVDVELHLPPWRTGGFGFVFEMAEGGVHVLEVLEGSAAESAGLESGDLLVEIDGVPAAELEMEEFRNMAIGEEGTEAEIVLERGDERTTITLSRQFLPNEEPP
jgi:hypothetical protein